MSQFVYGGLIVALLAGGGTTAYYFTAGSGAPVVAAVDGNLCRSDQPLVAHRIIVVDTSDSLSVEERKIVRHAIDADASGAAPYEKVSVLALEADQPYAPKRLFSACAPKKASDAKGISENPILYGAIWTHRFGAPLDKAVDEELTGNSQDTSPLVETIWAISRLSDFGPDVVHRRLDIVSDMLQNSGGYSQYHSESNFSAYAHTRFGHLHLPDLRGVTVVIHYLIRPATLSLQTDEHVRFWIKFFKTAGASKVEVIGPPSSPA